MKFVHDALFEDEFFLKSQIKLLKESLKLFMKYNHDIPIINSN